MTTQTIEPKVDNPILRWVRGKIGGMLKFAINHPLEAVVIAFVLWIALTGLADANWSAVPQQGIAQTIIAGEQRAFQEKVGVHLPAVTAWLETRLNEFVDFTSRLAGVWMGKFTATFMREYAK